MPRRLGFLVLSILASLPASPTHAQFLSDAAGLRRTYEVQVQWADSLASARRDIAGRFLEVAREVLSLKENKEVERAQLLAEAQGLSGTLASLAQETKTARTMVRETRERLREALEARVSALSQRAKSAPPTERASLEARIRGLLAESEAVQAREPKDPGPDPLKNELETLLGLVNVVLDEQARLETLGAAREEVRLFLGGLRLFDETAMPPSARSAGGGDGGPGCDPSACSVSGSSPADLPLNLVQPRNPGTSRGAGTLTPETLGTLLEEIRRHADVPGLPNPRQAPAGRIVAQETTVGVGLLAFRGKGTATSAPGPKVSSSLLASWPLGRVGVLTVEPSVGGRGIRTASSLFTELVGEVRETLSRVGPGRGIGIQVSAWQKGRYLSKGLPEPAYLEPGRLEAGLLGRLTLPLAPKWQLTAEGGGSGVRYEPEAWKVLDRQGFSGALRVDRSGLSRSIRLSLLASHHGFPHSRSDWVQSRFDTRLGVELDGSVENHWVLRFSLGGAWNQSRLSAYDFWSGRGAMIISTPWGKGALQAYLAVARQEYLNPGPEDSRVAPSHQDSGAMVSIQYGLPLDSTYRLLFRGFWSRSQTGFRDAFYERFGISVHVSCRELRKL